MSTPKFPIGSRVRHSYVGPATVTGHPFTGATGDVNLPVKFDNPHYDGSSGWHEVFFTLIEPLDGEMKDGSIYSAGRWHQIMPRKAVAGDIYPSRYIERVAVRTPFQYSGSADGPITFGEWARNRRTVALMERCDNERLARREFYEAHKDEVLKRVRLERRVEELEKQEVEMRLTAARALTELEAAREEIKRRVANIDKLEGTLDGIRRIMA